jgi:hypothetical protein
MKITRNLYAVLQQMRSQDTPKRFWADAVCINQSNLPEKGKQVDMMGAIYSEAARVIVWLGPDEEGIAEPAISVIQKFNRLVEKQVTPHQFFSGWGPLDNSENTITIQELKHAEKLFKGSWFTRVWVIQEVGVAKNVLFTWGSAKVDFIEIIQFICAWGTSNSGRQFPGVGFVSNYLSSLFSYIWSSYSPDHVETLDKAWFRNSALLQYEAQTMRQTQVLEFVDILFRCRRLLRSTDTRDFVYAFLAHPTAKMANGNRIVDADYDIDEAELRLRLFSILSQRSLRFLGLVWHRRDEELGVGPSWCPKFDSIKYFMITGRYDACHKILTAFQDMFSATVENGCLKTSTLIIDQVNLCGEVAGPIDKDFEFDAYEALRLELHEVLERYWLLAEQSDSQYPSAYEDKPMAFASTMIAAIESERLRLIAKRFEVFCQERCPLINKHLQDGWCDKWGKFEPEDGFFPFLERSASTIQSEKFFTTVKGY